MLILETFGYLDELVEAVAVASELSDVPIVAQATFADDAHTLGGETPREVATVLSGLPVAMLGANCTIGPQRMLTVAEDLVRYASVPVSAQPNAGPAAPHRAAQLRVQHRRRLLRPLLPPVRRGRRVPGRRLLRHHPGAHPRRGRRGHGGPRAGPGAAARPGPASPRRAGSAPGGRSPGPWPTSWPAAGSSSPPRSRPAGAPPRRCRPRRCCRPRAPGLFAVQPARSARTHSDSLDLALHLQQQAGSRPSPR